MSLIEKLLPHGKFWEMDGKSPFAKVCRSLSSDLKEVTHQMKDLTKQLTDLNEEAPFFRFLSLIPLPEKRLLDLDSKKKALMNLLDRSEPGSLSLSYIRKRLLDLGFKDFRIFDPTLDHFGLEALIGPMQVGIIPVLLQASFITQARAGFHAGSSLRGWRDLEFEKQCQSLLPAHVKPRFVYQQKK